MDFIDIISEILLYGSGLLVFVIVISFALSKAKAGDFSVISYKGDNYKTRKIIPLSKINNEQGILRNNQTIAYPQIFRLENQKPKEIKIIRKSTVTKRDSQESMRVDSKNFSRTNGDGLRYTIVNEEQKKQSTKVSNFYF